MTAVINAKGQKQVAMLVKPGAAFEHYYAANVDNYGIDNSAPMTLMLRGENKADKGLGRGEPGVIMQLRQSRLQLGGGGRLAGLGHRNIALCRKPCSG